jgi:spermidine synthase
MSELFFTELPGHKEPAPLPILVLARSARLVRRRDPEVLVLGYGLGKLGALLSAIRPQSRITGIELSGSYLRRAATVAPRNVELHHADAARYLLSTRRRFDLVIDDCFRLVRGEPVRIAALNRSAGLVRSRLRPGGVYVRNLIPEGDDDLEDQCRDLRAAFPHLVLRRFRDWDNTLAIATVRKLGPAELAQLGRA